MAKKSIRKFDVGGDVTGEDPMSMDPTSMQIATPMASSVGSSFLGSAPKMFNPEGMPQRRPFNIDHDAIRHPVRPDIENQRHFNSNENHVLNPHIDFKTGDGVGRHKKGGKVEKAKKSSGGKLSLKSCKVKTSSPGKKNSNW